MVGQMPAAEVEVTVDLVTGLIADQKPALADLEVRPIGSGWDNFSFRVGEHLVARMPRREAAMPLVAHEMRWLPVLAPRLPLPVPAAVFVGEPGRGYPWPWTLVPWIPGGPLTESSDVDLPSCADEVADFLLALHQPAPPQAPRNPFRGVPLSERDAAIRERIDRLRPELDKAGPLEVWGEALSAPPFDRDAVWLHGDFHPANLLVMGGHLSGVVDFGDITSGDPATDLAVAWMLFPSGIRRRFKAAYGEGDDSIWPRARGWALAFALAYIAHSADDETMRSIGELTLARILEDR